MLAHKVVLVAHAIRVLLAAVEEQQADVREGEAGKHDDVGGLLLLHAVGIDIGNALGEAVIARVDAGDFAAGADFVLASLQGRKKVGVLGRTLGIDFAAVAPATTIYRGLIKAI